MGEGGGRAGRILKVGAVGIAETARAEGFVRRRLVRQGQLQSERSHCHRDFRDRAVRV